MRYWEAFWLVSLLGAGFVFAFITVVVILKGGREIMEMLRALRQQQDLR
jgi:hypothetical protein